MLTLIDGDIVVYRGGFASERVYYTLKDKLGNVCYTFEPGTTKTDILTNYEYDKKLYTLRRRKYVAPISHACNNAKKVMTEILKNTEATHFEVYLTSQDKSNFRYDVATSVAYKSNRGKKPEHYQNIREYLINVWGAKVVQGAEADDILADRANALRQESVPHTIASIDKDLKQIMGNHYNISKKQTEFVSEYDAGLNLMTQLIYGDKVDTIPGIRYKMKKGLRIGPVKIKKILMGAFDATTPENICKYLYDKHRSLFPSECDLEKLVKFTQEQHRLLKLGDCEYNVLDNEVQRDG